MVSAHRIVATAVIAGSLLGLGGVVQAEEAGVSGPPFDAPAAIVTFDWPDKDELLLLYSATLSPDPRNNPGGPQGVSWEGGCNPDAVIHSEVQPLMLGEGLGFEGENRSPWPGNT